MKVLNDTIYLGGNSSSNHSGNFKAMVIKLTPDGTVHDTYYPAVTSLQAFTMSQITGNAYIGGGTATSTTGICKLKPGSGGLGGKPDTSFGNNGVANILLNAGETSRIIEIKLLPGYILAASSWAENNTNTTKRGVFFTLISQEGIVSANFGNGGNKFLLLPGATSIMVAKLKWTGEDNNRLLIFGEAIVGGLTKGFIAKVNSNGDLDATFGTNGVIWTTETFRYQIVFDNNGDMIAIQNPGFLYGGALAKLQIPADVYNRIKQGSWIGTVNNDWFTAGNWAEAMVPDAFTEVVIASGAVIIPANTHATAYKVTVMPGASLSLGANSILTITKNSP